MLVNNKYTNKIFASHDVKLIVTGDPWLSASAALFAIKQKSNNSPKIQIQIHADLEIPKMPLRAKEWLNFGTKQEHAMLGDVLIFSRTGGGHVGIYVGEDTNCFHVLGGNQGDRVSIVRIDKTRCIGVRRTKWKISQPKNVRKLFLPDVGVISKNER
jgi:hypothetical protein